jgi:type IV pilus assembly protein PilC
MATARTGIAERVFEWEGTDRHGRPASGEQRGSDRQAALTDLRRQGIGVRRLRPRHHRPGRPLRGRDIALFTRQLATLLKAGVPLLQGLDIVGRGSPQPQLAALLETVRADIETGVTLSEALRRHPQHFSPLYAHLVAAGESAGLLDVMLERLARHLEKAQALQRKVAMALMYPAVVVAVAVVVVAVIMAFVIPTFKDIFASFGADLPIPTLAVMAMSAFLVEHGALLLAGTAAMAYAGVRAWRRHEGVARAVERLWLRLPVVGRLLQRAAVARWARTLSLLFAAGVPLVDALRSVAGAAGSHRYADATVHIQAQVSTGASLTQAMQQAGLFPPMLLQMCAIGDASGTLDEMLGKAADFYEQEVDDQVAGLSSLLEPLTMLVLGVVIGGLVIAMYLPIFRLGQVV